MSGELAKLDAATRMLAEAKTLDEVTHIVNIAEAARVYARAAKLGLEAYNHAAEVKVRAERKAGELLRDMPKAEGGRPPQETSNTMLPVSDTPTLSDIGVAKMQSSRWQAIAAVPDEVFEQAIAEAKPETPITTNRIMQIARARERAEARLERQTHVTPQGQPIIYHMDALAFLTALPPTVDLLVTDPPYITDQPNIRDFAATWLPLAISRLKLTGQAYICAGSYPDELHAYLDVLHGLPEITIANILVWTYRNTIGPQPKATYINNWQAIFYLRGKDAPALDCIDILDQLAVQQINAPDGRQGDRFYKWQKPDELAERFILHSSTPGAIVVDPFAGSGTFLLAAAKHGRHASGCEIDASALAIAIERGCRYAD